MFTIQSNRLGDLQGQVMDLARNSTKFVELSARDRWNALQSYYWGKARYYFTKFILSSDGVQTVKIQFRYKNDSKAPKVITITKKLIPTHLQSFGVKKVQVKKAEATNVVNLSEPDRVNPDNIGRWTKLVPTSVGKVIKVN